MKVLVTGGAGYIGGFMVTRLLEEGHKVVVIDSLEKGFEDTLDKRADFRQGNIQDDKFLSSAIDRDLDGVIHFAAYISMAESMKKPYIYFQNNTLGTLNLLKELVEKDIKKFIFSSTAGVYGNPLKTPIPEDHQRVPTNPYGESKKMVEDILSWFQKIHQLNYVVLRYFNASGASLDGSRGERHNPETHLIPNILMSIKNDKEFDMYGTDYDTPDGTAVRDYIHVLDLVEAHLLAMNKIEKESGGFIYNVGTGNGLSIKQVVAKVEEIVGKNVKVLEKDRREGDASILVADPSRINRELNFSPKYSDIDTIVKSAWAWHNK